MVSPTRQTGASSIKKKGASPIRILRKILGIALILVNALLSVISFVAFYSAVFFAQSLDPETMLDYSAWDYGLEENPQYLYLGNITIDNTGLFDFDDFQITLELYEQNGIIFTYNEEFPGGFPAGAETNHTIYISEATGAWFNGSMSFNPMSWTNLSGFLQISGKYAFKLFEFSLNISNVTQFGF